MWRDLYSSRYTKKSKEFCPCMLALFLLMYISRIEFGDIGGRGMGDLKYWFGVEAILQRRHPLMVFRLQYVYFNSTFLHCLFILTNFMPRILIVDDAEVQKGLPSLLLCCSRFFDTVGQRWFIDYLEQPPGKKTWQYLALLYVYLKTTYKDLYCFKLVFNMQRRHLG